MLFTDCSSQKAVRAFEKAGFFVLKNIGTKHIGMGDGKRKIIIPRHTRLNPFTLKGIIRDAGLTDEEFKELI
jgi:predicted RNA binding protein YcfA (HicA-like mRNA interferase family)